MNKCDVCNKEGNNVVAGRWIFYCSDNINCKEKELNHIYENELKPDIESGDFSYTFSHGLADILGDLT